MSVTILQKSVSLSPTHSLSHRSSIRVPAQVLRATSGLPSPTASSTTPDAAGFVDISFRLYENEADKLVPVGLSDAAIARSLSQAEKWDAVLDPETRPQDRNSNLIKLLSLPADGQLQRYTSALIITPLPAADAGSSSAALRYTARTQGEPGTHGFRTFVQDGGVDVSPWHDVALYNADGTLNFVCEIPKDTTAKFEVATAEERNPIKQDVKKGALRHYPYAIRWNYGMLPQTWEDPTERSAAFPNIGGDDDPVDVVEIGGVPLETGSVYVVKFLGAYAMIDAGELDWKIICIRADHVLAGSLHDISDVEREMPGELEAIMVWFRDYKIPDGKPANQFGFGSSAVDHNVAKAVIDDTHHSYKQLMDGVRANIANLSLQ